DTSKGGAWRDTASVVAVEAHHVGRKDVKSRQIVGCHADVTVPGALEARRTDLRKHLSDRAERPPCMHLRAVALERTNTAEHEAAGCIETEGRKHLPRIPRALATRQDRVAYRLFQRRGSKIEIRQMHLFLAHDIPGSMHIRIGGNHYPLCVHRPIGGAHYP